ncbi:hypothetical protein V6N13_106876 [Hibiscus sabdariffa]
MADNDPAFILQISDQAIQNNLYFGDFSSDPDDGNVTMITKKLPMPPLMNFHLVSSCNGLLCLRATHPTFGLISIYNPFTRDYIELPKLITEHPSHHLRVLGFGFDPTTKKLKVVEVSYKLGISCGALGGHFIRSSVHLALHRPHMATPSSSSIESEVNILTVGSSTWRNLGRFPFHIMWQQSQVLVNGKLHWITYTKRSNATKPIMSFDLATEQFKEVPRPDSISPNRHIHELVVLRGCLSAVSFDNHNKELEIWVMDEYGVKESWVKELSMGAYVPKILQGQPNDERESMNSWMIYVPEKYMRVLCMLSSGRILLESNNKSLVLYDPHCKTFNDLQVTFEGIPRLWHNVETTTVGGPWSGHDATTIPVEGATSDDIPLSTIREQQLVVVDGVERVSLEAPEVSLGVWVADENAQSLSSERTAMS